MQEQLKERRGARIRFRIGPALQKEEDSLLVPEPVFGLVPHQIEACRFNLSR